jgi:hypothetical protein
MRTNVRSIVVAMHLCRIRPLLQRHSADDWTPYKHLVEDLLEISESSLRYRECAITVCDSSDVDTLKTLVEMRKFCALLQSNFSIFDVALLRGWTEQSKSIWHFGLYSLG